MNKVFLLITAILIINNRCMYSQEKETLYNISLGVSVFKINDKNFSPMVYKGFPFLSSIGLTFETSRYIDITNMFFQKGRIHSITSVATDNSLAKLINGSITWIHLRKLNTMSTVENNF
jgi:hypothetical protein